MENQKIVDQKDREMASMQEKVHTVHCASVRLSACLVHSDCVQKYVCIILLTVLYVCYTTVKKCAGF